MIENVQIIVVEDDAGIRKLMTTALSYCVNREVRAFENGEAAWTFLQRGGLADLVVSDVDMPVMNGFELMARVKEKLPATVVILMSGIEAHESAAQVNGADGFLAKPFDINLLFEIVQRYVVEQSQA